MQREILLTVELVVDVTEQLNETTGSIDSGDTLAALPTETSLT